MKIITRSVLLVFVVSCLGWATTIRPMSIERLTQLASSIVEAQAIQTWSDWNPQHTQIDTYTRLAVTRSFKGGPTSTVVVKQPGGTKDGITEVFVGVRHFKMGDDSFLFLEPSSDNDGTMRVVGLMQGHFAVYTVGSEKKVSNGVPNVTSMGPDGKLVRYGGARMSVQELESRVTKAVAR